MMDKLQKAKKIAVPAVSLINLGLLLFAMLYRFGKDYNLFQVAFLKYPDIGEKTLTYSYVMLVSLFFVFLISVFSSITVFFKKNASQVLVQSIGLTIAMTDIAFSVYAEEHLRILLPISMSILYLGLIVFLLVIDAKEKKENPDKQQEDAKTDYRFIRISDIVISALSLILIGSTFFFPFYYTNSDSYRLIDALNAKCDDILVLISFLVCFLIFLYLFIYTVKNLSNAETAPQKFMKNVKNVLYATLAYTLAFYIYSVVLARYFENNNAAPSVYSLTAVPFLLSAFFVVLEAILSARYVKTHEDEGKYFSLGSRITVLLFSLVMDGLAITTSLSNILAITVNPGTSSAQSATIVGWDMLTDYKNLTANFQNLAFMIFFSIIIIVLFLVFDLMLFFRHSRSYYRVSYVGIVLDYMLVFGLMLFGFFYAMAQKTNMENVLNFLAYKKISADENDTFGFTNYSMIYFIISTAVLVALVLFRPFSNHLAEEAVDVNVKSTEGVATNGEGKGTGLPNSSSTLLEAFDPCPAFTEVDLGEKEREEKDKERNKHAFENPTLSSITQFVIDYARDSRLHLSYSKETIATFIAGLGATKLTILQGMSGTGKTSLPKIFSEALDENCQIVEVESSWKDKNELIGYYNEFTRLFTPKKFTQALYASTLDKDVPTFIVLDEMNLSRIEYYFSDFLSLMENEEDKRTFRLTNVPLERMDKDEKKIPYLGLEKGHTIRITPNIWFIGTANRDESTFEISDKVYDRANTINLNKRAPKAIPQGDPKEPKYVSYDVFHKLLEEAKSKSTFALENVSYLPEVEKILSPYNISYGNRIANQMEAFVRIYDACFDDGKDHTAEAMESILLSKVVSKLEYKSVENKDDFADAFEKLGLHKCADFISHLSEDD